MEDPVVEAVRADLLQRSQVGIAKYGATLTRTDLSLRDWLQHAYEETLDQANYLKRAIIEISEPTESALDFLRRLDCTFEPIEFMARVLDTFHVEQMQRNAEANRERFAQNIRGWVEDLQPGDLRNRSTAELQDELHRRQSATWGVL